VSDQNLETLTARNWAKVAEEERMEAEKLRAELELVKLRADLASARKVIERMAELEPSLRIGMLSDTMMLRVEYAMEWLKHHPTNRQTY
jgi:hypothetical protein